MQKLSKKNGVKDDESSWYWDPPSHETAPTRIDIETESAYKNQIQSLKSEISALKAKDNNNAKGNKIEEEMSRLQEENKNLTMNLEDLDNQHQMAMEKLLALKKELQKNFEVLKQEHEDLKNTNNDYSAEIKELQTKIIEQGKESEKSTSLQSELDTLHHKYQNLERVHGLLKETTEKFQEENQELYEEVFKLQEKIIKLEHDIELSSKHSELSDVVPRDRYEDLLKELSELRDNSRNLHQVQLDESNIDDNAKSMIENLRREINDLKHKLAQKDLDQEPNTSDPKYIKTDVILYLYDQYVNFELPVDYIWNIPSTGDNTVMYKLEGAFKTLHEFKKDIDSLENALAEKSINEKRLQTQIDELSSENDLLTTDVQTYYSELTEMRKNNDFLLSEITSLKNTSKLQPIIETHEDNLVKLESELADSNQMNKTFQSEIQKIEKELSEVRSEKISLEENLRDLRNMYNLMTQELETYKVQNKQVEELQNNVNLEQIEKLKKASEEIDSLRKKIHAADTKNEQLAIDLSIAENDKVLLLKQVDDIRNDLNDKSAAFDQLILRSEELENKLKENEANITEADKSKMDAVNKNKELLNAVEILEKEKDEIQYKEKGGELQMSEKLEKLMKDYDILRATNSKLIKEIEVFQNREKELLHELNQVRTNYSSREQNLIELQRLNDDLKLKIAEHHPIVEELATIKANNSELVLHKDQLANELSICNNKLIHLQEDLNKTNTELKMKEKEIEELNSIVAENSTQSVKNKDYLVQLENLIVNKDNEIIQMQKSLNEVHQKLHELDHFKKENEKLQSELLDLKKQLTEKESEFIILKSKLSESETNCSEHLKSLHDKTNEVKELNQSLLEIKDKIKASENTTQHNDEAAKLLEEKQIELNEVVDKLKQKEQILTELEIKFNDIEKKYSESKVSLEQAVIEKGELINLITLKHNESIQYHNEIQRLNQVLLDQNSEFKRIVEEKDKLIHSQTELVNKCQNCERLNAALKEKDASAANLTENAMNYQKIKDELTNANDVIVKLNEKCDNLDKNLRLQLDIVKNLTEEKMQVIRHFFRIIIL